MGQLQDTSVHIVSTKNQEQENQINQQIQSYSSRLSKGTPKKIWATNKLVVNIPKWFLDRIMLYTQDTTTP